MAYYDQGYKVDAGYLPRVDTKNYLLSGMQSGQNLQKGALELQAGQSKMQQGAVLKELAPKIMAGNKAALAQAYQLDPTGESFKGVLGQQKEFKSARDEFLARGAFDVLNAPPEMRQQVYQEFNRRGVESGYLPPEHLDDTLDDSDIETMKQLVRGGMKFEDLATTTEQDRKAGLDERKLNLEERKIYLDEANRQKINDLEERKFQLDQMQKTQDITKEENKLEQAKIEQQSNFIEKEAAALNNIQLIDDLIKAPGLSAAVGFGLQKLNPLQEVDERGDPVFRAGTEAANFKARYQQIKGEAFLQAFQRLKGGGTITEAEGKKAESALNRMNLSQSEDEFIKAANDYKNIIQAGLERDRQRAQRLGIVEQTSIDYKSKYGLE